MINPNLRTSSLCLQALCHPPPVLIVPGQDEVFVLLLRDASGADRMEAPLLVHPAVGAHGLLVGLAPARRNAAVGLVGGAVFTLQNDSLFLPSSDDALRLS